MQNIFTLNLIKIKIQFPVYRKEKELVKEHKREINS